METPEFKSGGMELPGIMNNRSVEEMRRIDQRSLVGLYVSELFLISGAILILLNNLNVLAPGTYFGKFSWVTATVFSLGIIINFVSIPFLYFSSFKNFVKENDFWDKQTFWILPMFFFGTFYLYGSEISYSLVLMIVSVIIIAVVHFKFILSSHEFLLRSSDEALMRHQQYFTSLKYLTLYYVILLGVIMFFNPLQHLFVWIRTTFWGI
ncbi:MAG TPA: hypothetical protein VF817_00200 [Patescibacteria group bacterium]